MNASFFSNVYSTTGFTEMNAPASTVLLYEVNGYEANITTPGENQSPSGWGWTYWTRSNIPNGTGLYETGFMGGGQCLQSDGNGGPSDGYYALTGIHTSLANWLLADGHVKALHGSSVSPGPPGSSSTAYCGGNNSAGTAVLGSDPSGPFAATMNVN